MASKALRTGSYHSAAAKNPHTHSMTTKAGRTAEQRSRRCHTTLPRGSRKPLSCPAPLKAWHGMPAVMTSTPPILPQCWRSSMQALTAWAPPAMGPPVRTAAL